MKRLLALGWMACLLAGCMSSGPVAIDGLAQPQQFVTLEQTSRGVVDVTCVDVACPLPPKPAATQPAATQPAATQAAATQASAAAAAQPAMEGCPMTGAMAGCPACASESCPMGAMHPEKDVPAGKLKVTFKIDSAKGVSPKAPLVMLVDMKQTMADGKPYFAVGQAYRVFYVDQPPQVLVGSVAAFDAFVTDSLGGGEKHEVNILP